MISSVDNLGHVFSEFPTVTKSLKSLHAKEVVGSNPYWVQNQRHS